jgi:hypothetical protein
VRKGGRGVRQQSPLHFIKAIGFVGTVQPWLIVLIKDELTHVSPYSSYMPMPLLFELVHGEKVSRQPRDIPYVANSANICTAIDIRPKMQFPNSCSSEHLFVGYSNLVNRHSIPFHIKEVLWGCGIMLTCTTVENPHWLCRGDSESSMVHHTLHERVSTHGKGDRRQGFLEGRTDHVGLATVHGGRFISFHTVGPHVAIRGFRTLHSKGRERPAGHLVGRVIGKGGDVARAPCQHVVRRATHATGVLAVPDGVVG